MSNLPIASYTTPYEDVVIKAKHRITGYTVLVLNKNWHDDITTKVESLKYNHTEIVVYTPPAGTVTHKLVGPNWVVTEDPQGVLE